MLVFGGIPNWGVVRCIVLFYFCENTFLLPYPPTHLSGPWWPRQTEQPRHRHRHPAARDPYSYADPKPVRQKLVEKREPNFCTSFTEELLLKYENLDLEITVGFHFGAFSKALHPIHPTRLWFACCMSTDKRSLCPMCNRKVFNWKKHCSMLATWSIWLRPTERNFMALAATSISSATLRTARWWFVKPRCVDAVTAVWDH